MRRLQPRWPLRGRRLRPGQGRSMPGRATSRSGRCRATTLRDRPPHVPDQPGAVFGVAFSPDGRRSPRRVSGACRSATPKARAGRPARSSRGTTGDVFAVAFHPDGKQIAAAGRDRIIRLWDPDTGAGAVPPRSRGIHPGPGLQPRWEPPGLRERGPDGPALGHRDRSPRGHLPRAPGLRDGPGVPPRWPPPRLGRHGPDGQDLGPGPEASPWPSAGTAAGSSAWHFSPDGARVVSGGGRVGADRSVRVWDAATGRELLSYEGHQQNSSGSSGSAPTAGTSSRSTSTSRSGSGTRRTATTSPRRSTIRPSPSRWFGMRLGHPTRRPGARHRGPGWDDPPLGPGDRPGASRILRGHTGKVVGLAYARDGRRLASTSALGGPSRDDAQPGGELKLWDVATGRELATPRREHRRLPVAGVQPRRPPPRPLRRRRTGTSRARPMSGTRRPAPRSSPSAATPATSSRSPSAPTGRGSPRPAWTTTVKLWDAATGQEVFTLRGHTAGVNCVAFSPDGHRLVSGGIDWTARVWDATPWNPESTRSAEGP